MRGIKRYLIYINVYENVYSLIRIEVSRVEKNAGGEKKKTIGRGKEIGGH